MSTKKNETVGGLTVDEHVLRTIQVNYESAIREVYSQTRWLRESCDDAERNPDGAHTPGNISRTAACLDAAREKAYTLRQTLEVLGVPPTPVDERLEGVRKIARLPGKKIEAIKLHRELFGSSLFDAKKFVESIDA